MIVEEEYLARCITLAKQGIGKVAPNPMVGSVIVHHGKIIGEGFHRKYEESHAEVNAIASVKDESLLKESTLYVNLEPCSHYGKTPPCAELIIKKQIPRVVIGCLDPYKEVAGRGVRMLREAGVEVVTGILEKESYDLNKNFMTNQILCRPYIYLKWAQSADGFMDRIRHDAGTPPILFSSPEMLQQVHKKRSEVSAIMVGTKTALLDNPSLTVRNWSGKSPVRIVLDRELTIPSHYHLLDGKVRTIVFTSLKKGNEENIEYITIDYNQDILNRVLSYLHSQHINSLLVEGGSYLLNSFLKKGLWDEIQVETSAITLHEGIKAPVLVNVNSKHSGVSVYYRKNVLRE